MSNYVDHQGELSLIYIAMMTEKKPEIFASKVRRAPKTDQNTTKTNSTASKAIVLRPIRIQNPCRISKLKGATHKVKSYNWYMKAQL